MQERVVYLWPEIALFLGTCIVMVLGLSPRLQLRRLCAWVVALALGAAGVLAYLNTPIAARVSDGTIDQAGQLMLPHMVAYAKVVTAAVGLLLVLLLAGTVDRDEEAAIASGRQGFNPLRTNRAEFWSFFLFSLTGLMLCASADDLIWLFLALELTSLPTYIMVAMSDRRARAQEAGVKYFFLGALGAAVFLFGFALIYGGTGSTNLNQIHDSLAAGGMNGIALAGVLMSLIGVGFKIAAVPMHFYTPDVYQGASSGMAAFLAFVPKSAGFIAILLLAATVGWTHGAGGTSLPDEVRVTLWVMAALTMTVGNVLAILQDSVKRMLAYSSIAHSGYMLVGVIAGPGKDTFTTSGVSAVLFYLLAYGLTSVGTFAVLACLERKGKDGRETEIETVADLRGLCASHPLLGWTMVLCSLSLLGMPPLLGFFGKLPLFTAGIASGEGVLVVVLALNSAIAAFYYLRLAGAPLLEKSEPGLAPAEATPFGTRRLAAGLSGAAVIALAVFGARLMDASERAASTSAYPNTGKARREVPADLSGTVLRKINEGLASPRVESGN